MVRNIRPYCPLIVPRFVHRGVIENLLSEVEKLETDSAFLFPAQSGRRWRAKQAQRWPPSAAQTGCAVFPRPAFMKTLSPEMRREGYCEVDPLRTRRVNRGRQYPRTMMYGFFRKELIHLIALPHLASLLFLPVFVRCLPRPTLAADHSVTRLSPCFGYHAAVRLLTEHRSPFRFRL